MTQHIWGEGVKVFISHATSTRPMAGELKALFADLGVSAFVAHEDIKITAQWQEVILEALSSTDAFLAILSCDFKKSAYCDQELGFAIAERRRRADANHERPLIIMAVMYDDTVPYGFISNEQAAKVRQAAYIPSKVLDTLLEKDFDLWFKSFIRRIRRSPSYYNSNYVLAPELIRIERLTSEQAHALVDAINANSDVYDAWHFMSALDGKIVQCPGIGHISFRKSTGYSPDRIHFIYYSDDSEEDPLPPLPW